MTINLKELFTLTTDLNEKVINKLLSALKDNELKDFDYLKFKQSYKSLCEMGMDEGTASKSAFLTASTMGLTKDKLLLSVQHYKNILNKEKEQFALALKNQVANNVDAKMLDINKMQEKIQENKRKMEQIEREQAILASQIEGLQENLTISKSKIEETRDQFKNTFDKIYAELEDDKTLYDSIL